MTERLFDDLGLWEEGGLPLAELEARHPGEDVAGLIQTIGLFSRAAEGSHDVERGWLELRPMLPDRRSPVRRPARAWKRSMLAIAAVLLVGGPAVAMGPRLWRSEPDLTSTKAPHVPAGLTMPSADAGRGPHGVRPALTPRGGGQEDGRPVSQDAGSPPRGGTNEGTNADPGDDPVTAGQDDNHESSADGDDASDHVGDSGDGSHGDRGDLGGGGGGGGDNGGDLNDPVGGARHVQSDENQ